MVAVVRHLVEELVGFRVEFVDPVEAPFRFVEDVGDTVRFGRFSRPIASVRSPNLALWSSYASNILAVALLAVIRYFN